jgi:S1-C subfamily serine protease
MLTSAEKRLMFILFLLALMLLISGSKAKAAETTDCTETLPAMFDRVSPAAVYIHAISINPYRETERVEHIIGSGFIIDSQGIVLTNSHVAFGRQSLIVKLQDGTSFSAKLLGADPMFDIAVLQIPKPEKELTVVKLGSSDGLRVGDEVVALGNPLGLDQSLTRGIVSAVNRVLSASLYSMQEPLIQVDTPINHGNSGGPLLNRCGEVVGITTAVMSDAQNIGFAIPIDLVKSVLPLLLEQGRVIRPWLGFHGQFIDDELKKLLRLPLRTGLLVEAVEPGSPAEKAKLQGGSLEMTIDGDDILLGGDIITWINGKPMDSSETVVAVLEELQVGMDINLTIFRDGRLLDIRYQLPERPLLPGDLPSYSTTDLIGVHQIFRSARFKF